MVKLVAGYGSFARQVKKYQQSFKNHIVPPFLSNEVDQEVTYHQQHGIPQVECLNSNLVHDSVFNTDAYREDSLEFTSSPNDSIWESKFYTKGKYSKIRLYSREKESFVMIMAPLAKRFSSPIFVVPRRQKRKSPPFARPLKEMENEFGLALSLGGVEFDEQWHVFSRDLSDTQRLIGQTLRQAIKRFRKEIGHPGHIALLNRTLYVMIESDLALLKPPLDTPLTPELLTELFNRWFLPKEFTVEFLQLIS